jgi:hypothetical protein
MKRPLLICAILLLTLPALARDRCLVLGDSIAQGITMRLSECDRASRVGIGTHEALKLFSVLPDATTVVISLGSNDSGLYPFTGHNLREMRGRIHASTVIWILPAKPSKHSAVRAVAKDFGDSTLSLEGILSPDGVHPTGNGYADLAISIRKCMYYGSK